MKNELEFTFKGVHKILEKLILERDRLNVSAYKTLVTTMSEYMRNIWKLPVGKIGELDYFKCADIENHLANEISKLEDIIEKSINDGQYKDHYSWVLSYQKLTDQRSELMRITKRSNKYEKLPQHREQSTAK